MVVEDQTEVVIHKTEDYSIFKKLKGNRPIHPRNVKDLIDMLKKNNRLKYFPIMVNENMEVCDGQHRLEAAKELGLPIYYQIDPDADIATTRDVNTVGIMWSLEDFLNNFLVEGLKDYQLLSAFWHNNKQMLTLSQAIFMWSGNSQGKQNKFKTGELHFGDIVTRKKAMEFLNQITQINAKAVKNTHLQRAIYFMCNIKSINMVKVQEVFGRYPQILEYLPNDYWKILQMIEERYNIGSMAYVSILKEVQDNKRKKRKKKNGTKQK